MLRILIVEDDPERCEWFQQQFIGCSVDFTCSVAEAIEWLKTRKYDNIFLDHDLKHEHYFDWDIRNDAETGYAVVRWITENTAQREAKFVVHSLNPSGGKRMYDQLRSYGYNVQHVPYIDLKKRMRFYA